MSINRDFSKFPNVITAAGDAKILNLTAADITYDGVSLLGGGGSSTDTTVRRLQVDATNDTFYEEYILRAVGQYSGWTTIKTIAVTGGGTGTYTSGIVSATISGVTNGSGVGSRIATWHWSTNANVFTIGSMADNASQAEAPQFQLALSGTNILIQVRGSATHTMTGTIHLRITIPPTSGGATYSIT